MTNDDTSPRAMDPAEIALIVRMMRTAKGLTQETLAEIAGITTRSIQRLEKSEPTSVDVRRAVAGALEIGDLDAFNRVHDMAAYAKAVEEEDERAKNMLTLPVTVLKSGKEVAEVAERMTMHSADVPEDIGQEAREEIAELLDYLRDYGDIHEEYSYSDKIALHDTLSGYLARIARLGFSVCCAERATKVVGKNWVDKTPWPVTVVYFMVAKRGKEPTSAMVPKALQTA